MAVIEASGYVLEENFSEWPWPQGNLLGTEGSPSQTQKQKHERAPFQWDFSVTVETWNDGQIASSDHFPTWAFCCFYNLGNAIRDVSGFNK